MCPYPPTNTSLVSPVSVPRRPSEPIAPRALVVRPGSSLGILDNAKNNADLLLAEVARLLERTYDCVLTVARRKPSSAVPASEDDLERLSACDLVVTATGD